MNPNPQAYAIFRLMVAVNAPMATRHCNNPFKIPLASTNQIIYSLEVILFILSMRHSFMATILIIDAAASIANPIAHALRQDGHVSLVALDADKAWLLMQQFQIDILITDRYLPGQSGEALIRRLRSHPRLARLPVIVMSTDAPADLDAIWLTKPLPAKHVQATVEQLLQATIDPRLNGRVS